VAQVANAVSTRVVGMLSAPTGLPACLAAIASRENIGLAEIGTAQVLGQNIAAELAERSAGVQYPVFYVYCEKLKNNQREKFRTFSGKAGMAVEVRVSRDRLEDVGRLVELYAEAATNVLDLQRGNWGEGMYYTGGYEVVFGGVKHGGKNFIQSARVTFDVDVSIG
jgi:hypothetical protein